MALGIAGGGIGRAAALVAPFIAIPLLYKHLGTAEFGLWTTITSVTAMLAFSDFGIGNSLLTRLSTFQGNGDALAARKYTATAYVALGAIAVTLMLVTAAVVMSPSLVATLLSSEASTPSARLIIATCLILFCLGLPAGVIYRVMYARQQVWLAHLWQFLAAMASIALCYLAVRGGTQGWVAVAAYSSAPIIAMIAASLWYFSRNPEAKPAFKLLDKVTARDLIGLGSGFFVLAVLTSISLNADNLILARNAGLESVAAYAVPAKLASLQSLLVTTLYLPLWSANGEALARGDTGWVKATSRKMSIYGALAVAVVGLVMVLFDKQIMTAWVGQTFPGQRINLALLSALSVAMALTSPYFMILNSKGQVSLQIKLFAIFLVLTVAAKLMFATAQTVWTVPLITLLGYLLIISPAVYSAAVRLLEARPTRP